MKSSSSTSHSSPYADVDKFVEDLPRATFMNAMEFYNWEGYWFYPDNVKAAVTFRTSFDARDDDVFLVSSMKTGTTWLKALLFCIVQRQSHQTLDDHHLTMNNPHFLVPTIESFALLNPHPPSDPYDASAPRLLHTHLPHALLPDSVKNSTCKIVYVARNPKDTVISSWHFQKFYLKPDQQPIQLEEFIDHFCNGMHPYGPFVEHVAQYWEESRKKPHKILFLKYEELKNDPKRQVLRIAEFLGRPFGDNEGGEADEFVRKCSFERLKNLEVNKSGFLFPYTPNSIFFRKGEVGDCNNYLTPEMEMKIDQSIRLKLEAIGLYF